MANIDGLNPDGEQIGEIFGDNLSESSDGNLSDSDDNESDNEPLAQYAEDNVPLAQLRENRRVARPNLDRPNVMRAEGNRIGEWEQTAYRSGWLQNFEERSGPLIHTADSTPHDIFSSYISDDLLDIIVLETNRYYNQYLVSQGGLEMLPKNARARKWTDLTRAELKAFLALMMAMGLTKRGNYDLYWSTEWLIQMDSFGKVMPRDRFMLILQFLHVANNDNAPLPDDPNRDKSFKIRQVIDHLVPRWQAAYYPGRELSVDESIIAFKGNTGFMTYNPKKPHKWGMKAWMLADSACGYVFNWSLYTGAIDSGDIGVTHKIVNDICTPVLNHGHHVYMDNYFSSPALYNDLANNGTGACGTLRRSRSGVPDVISNARLKKGDDMISTTDNKLQFIAWFDKRQVNLISSIHNDSTFERMVRARNEPDHMREVTKPCGIELYTQHMGGVDMADRQLWTYLHVHKSLKWWKKVFVYLIELSFVNALMVYRACDPPARNRFRSDKFRSLIISSLLDGYQSISRPLGRRSRERPLRLTERHFIAANPHRMKDGRRRRQDCIVCSDRNVKRHQTELVCIECRLPMCATPCHLRYHTLLDYKSECSKEYHE